MLLTDSNENLPAIGNGQMMAFLRRPALFSFNIYPPR